MNMLIGLLGFGLLLLYCYLTFLTVQGDPGEDLFTMCCEEATKQEAGQQTVETSIRNMDIQEAQCKRAASRHPPAARHRVSHRCRRKKRDKKRHRVFTRLDSGQSTPNQPSTLNPQPQILVRPNPDPTLTATATAGTSATRAPNIYPIC